RSSVHFGVISCAACSAFFRRTVSENRKYSCRRSSEGGFNCPIDQQHRCYCRSCRFQKCLLMGMNPESKFRDFSASSIKLQLSVGHSPGNTIVLMVRSYQQMLERRRLVYCPGSIRDILNGTKPVSTCSGDHHRTFSYVLMGFISMFRIQNLLVTSHQAALIKRFSVPFAILEKYYITMCAGGLQTNRLVRYDGTYSDLNDPDGSVDRDTLNKLFVQSLKDFLLELSAPMYYNKMSDVEFCALNAVLLFDQAAPGLSEKGCRIVREARKRVYNDWFELYRKTGVRDIGQKVGNTMLLLPAVQVVETTQENFRLIQIFDLFQYDKILDELMYLDD
ncbi:unnamed protein product, partial [Haemonchus placei]|uniref:Nuclear receptor domain-containing protein n=1 Tax=Haemonchus placei TaxID=6290 RepID=A0A158QJW2_HAEPC